MKIRERGLEGSAAARESKRAHRHNRARQRQGHPGRRAWREAPATAEQISALRAIASESGRTFKVDVSRGEAWRRIKAATTLIDEPARVACAPPWSDAQRSR